MKSSLLLAVLVIACSLSLKAQNADGVFTKVDEKPEPVRTVAPACPKGETGLVAVSLVIDETGKVLEAAISKSTNNALDQAALAALQNWSFKPAKVGGKAVKSKVTVPIRFDDQA